MNSMKQGSRKTNVEKAIKQSRATREEVKQATQKGIKRYQNLLHALARR